MKTGLFAFVILFHFIGCSPKNKSYKDITQDIAQQVESIEGIYKKTTIKELLSTNSADKIYINYSQLNFPNHQWSDQKEFLLDMKLTVKNNKKLVFSNTLTSFFVINNNEVIEQYVIDSDVIASSPEWYDPSIAYIAGVWNTHFNSPNDSVYIYPQKMEIIVFSSPDK
ncbi:hypothetical protein ERX46_14665 [Brumimicrobium glaciale]|uniref:Uncharacterized protein n=1 Tax=Brumimicrobium glaciale TaxID=200475 RepID=A0A4Q4KH01_9FLAO|nr:hypothetical protein [Brumimicrobium glaciale]RYM32513.1 hypothetical protein ERX46_14665 [Brumimicrobium glaciale]